jgi:catechol 2,3-dioxygenase-like lactoylglutathione lyase family enzyme
MAKGPGRARRTINRRAGVGLKDPLTLKSAPIVAFVATSKPADAKKFYAKTLGLRLVSEDGFALAFDAAGTTLRVAIVRELRPAPYTVLGWTVPDIKRAVRALAERGITFQRYDDFLDQDEHAVWSAPSGAKVAWFQDPDGNTLSLTEFKQAPRRTRRAIRR